MKIKRLNRKKTAWLALAVTLLLVGCGKTESTADKIEDTEWQTEDRQSIAEDKKLKKESGLTTEETEFGTDQDSKDESDMAGNAMNGGNNEGIVRIALIDTGLSTQAIPSENIAEGKNYLYQDASTEDTYGHGTAVASVILQSAPEVQLVPLVSNVYENGKIKQVENDTFAEMIRDAIDVYECQIINISAGLILDKESVREAAEYAEEQGVLIVASAGNDYAISGETVYYPAAYDTVLSVGALNSDGTEIADFSQRGDWVDAYAIGENITIRTLSGSTRTSDGTSYSAAIVTAEAAVLLSADSKLTPAELRSELKEEFAGK